MLKFPAELGLDGFLKEYWQRKPLLLRQAIDPEYLQLPPEELAGLACEDDIESRLISQQGERWQLQHGPFDDADFAALPEHDWTLLVQDADKHLPEVARLLEDFEFLPDWRIDDIMISYATEDGGVGPHTDQYDVFLVQAQGQRRWRLSDQHYTDADLLTECPLRVLSEFSVSADHVLNPGDVLYLPPHLAHWGTAIGECMTWSVGMRGASQHDLAAAWLAHRQQTTPNRLMQDHLTPTQTAHKTNASSRLRTADAQQARELIAASTETQSEAASFDQWLSAYLTEPKAGFEWLEDEAPIEVNALRTAMHEGIALIRHPWARIARIDGQNDEPMLCWQGQCQSYSEQRRTLVDLVAARRRIQLTDLEAVANLSAEDWTLLQGWIMQGLLQLDA